MSKPLIGITSSSIFSNNEVDYSRVNRAYIQAILSAGGIPILLPNMLTPSDLDTLCSHLDGILLPGGGDIEAKRYEGGISELSTDVCPERDELELSLVKMCADTDWPLLGICRGVQVINVALGGNLYSDIPTQYPTEVRHNRHDVRTRSFLAHEVTIKENSVLSAILNKPVIRVNSFHHQALRLIGKGLRVTSVAPDGIIEGLELTGHRFLMGVQWHPECLPGHREDRAIFEAFIQAAQSK